MSGLKRRTSIRCQVIIILSFILFISPTAVNACSQITALYGDTVLFGNNEDADWGHPLGPKPKESAIFFYPASSQPNWEATPGKYGAAYVGWLLGEGGVSIQGGVNERGLAYDMTAVEGQINPHPEKQYNLYSDGYFFGRLLRECATVEEAIELFENYDFDGISAQFQVADAEGDSVVIGPGPDGELKYTRKPAGDGYQFSTALANLAYPESQHKRGALRRSESAADIMGGIDGSVTLDNIRDTLEAVRQKGDVYTVYSNIFDLRNGIVFLYYLSDFDEVVRLDLAAELTKGEHYLRFSDIFPERTVSEATNRYFRIKVVQFALMIGVLVILVGVGLICIRFILRWRRERSR